VRGGGGRNVAGEGGKGEWGKEREWGRGRRRMKTRRKEGEGRG